MASCSNNDPQVLSANSPLLTSLEADGSRSTIREHTTYHLFPVSSDFLIVA